MGDRDWALRAILSKIVRILASPRTDVSSTVSPSDID